jgi:large subunit ribosomal protein L15
MAHADRKTRKLRGSRTHGYGNAQKHRGAGSRGGRGMAGSKKQKWIRVVKDNPGYFGSKGFTRHGSLVSKPASINIGYLSDNIGRFVADGFAVESDGSYKVDLSACGYGKLLGAGSLDVKLKLKVDECSKKAREKVEAAGGSVECAGRKELSDNESDGGSKATEETGG